MQFPSSEAIQQVPEVSFGTGVEETVARQIIASYRQRLEWILLLPELESLFAEGLEELQLPGPRKGIGLRPALSALLIENKFSLIRWTIRNFRHLFPATHAERLSREFGLDPFNSLDLDDTLSLTQWASFQSGLIFSLGREHRRYKHAQAILYYAYQGLVEKTVNRIVFDPGKRLDCIQEGSIALLHAIDKVDDSGTALGAYASLWIRRHVKNFIMGERFPVHVPINLASKALCRASSMDTGEKTAAPAKARDEQTEKKMVLLLEQLRQPSVSLNQIFEDSAPLADLIPDEEAQSPEVEVAQKDLRELIRTVIATLTEKQREVLEMRYGLNGHRSGQTLSQISKAIGISHQQVSMREKRALQKLGDSLAPYLREIHA